MSDNAKLSLSLVGFFVLTLGVIYAGYVHGNMHLFKTLEAAAQIWK